MIRDETDRLLLGEGGEGGACGILVPNLGSNLAVEAWNPNQWTARKVPKKTS